VEHEAKSLKLTLKADSESGEFAATFSRFNVIDHHGDVTLPDAFKAGAEVLIGGYNHARTSLPVGKGSIVVDGDVARVEGSFFLDTPHGEAAYKTIKAAGSILEWSYVFGIKEASFGMFEDGDGVEREVRFLKALDVMGLPTRVKDEKGDRPWDAEA